jgi:RNA polymerase sigma-70 factor, ECF subfamily
MNELAWPLEFATDTAGVDLFSQHLERYQRLVFRTAWRMLGNREEAEDVAQEVFLKLHQQLGRLPEGEEPASWLYRVTVNQCLDLVRRRRTLASEEVLAGVASGEQTPEERAESSEQMARLARWIPRLAEGERSALVLRELEGLPTKEVAGILGVSEETVRTSVHRAKEKLRLWMK